MNIHLILQSKGGVGKSIIATFLTQFLKNKMNKNVACLDIDPSNQSFFAFKEFNTTFINILDSETQDIDPNKFDEIYSYIENLQVDDLIIDSGSSCYIPFLKFIIANSVIELLKELGHNVIIHTVIVGGKGQNESKQSIYTLIKNLENFAIPTYVWNNPYFGKFIDNNNTFTESNLYKELEDQIAGVIELPKFDVVFNNALEEIQQKNLTFESAIQSDQYNMLKKQRIKNIKSAIFESINPFFGE